MTSTNDGKDVKSNKSSGPRGKTHYIELYKSLEARLCEECGLRTRTQHLCEAWRHVHSLCLHSAPNTHSHLLAWLQRHTAKTVLQTEWQSPNFKDEHIKLEEAINQLISETNAAASSRNGTHLLWENQLLQRGEWFKSILANPWGHPVLRVLLDPQGNRPSDDEVLEWLKEDRGVVFVTRLRQLAASKCDDLALLLATAVMERVRATTKIVPDELQTDEPKDNSKSEDGEAKFEDILRTEAGFTSDVWELVTDLELVLLHKRDKHPQCIALAKKVPLLTGYQLVERLRNRLESSPREKKLWKNAKDVATLVAQVVIARCMVVPVCVDVARGALYCCARSLVRLLAASRLPEAAAALAAPAATARHLHTLAAAVHAQSTEDMKPFVCELYVRAITAGLNELEKLKLKTEKASEARSMEQTLSTWFTQLGLLLSASARIQCECILTAFSVHASPAMYEKIQNAPVLPAVEMHVEPKEETTSEFGSWANDSRSQTNFVKTSETLNLKHRQQNNIFSSAILTEGEALGLGAELCQDLTVCLSGPRVKTLSWDMNRKLLLDNCRMYMERTRGGTRALTTELKYLNLDPSVYQHLPEEEENENDLYYGIEKGYEHLVEFPEPEEIWQDVEDFERTDTAYSSGTDTGSVIVRRKKKHKKRLLFSDEEDPLGIHTDVRIEKKKERPHSKERSKDRSKETKRKQNTSIDPEIKQQQKEKQKEKSQNKERKKREKKERKKSETVPLEPKPGSLSSLVGMKVMRIDLSASVDLIHGVNISDYDVQGKSMKSPRSENDSNVVFDGLYSMDEIKSPETGDPLDDKSSSSQPIFTDSREIVKKTPLMYGIANLDKNKPKTSTYIPGKDQKSPAPSNVKSVTDNLRLGLPRPQSYGTVNEQVKRSITKLLQFRRQGIKSQTGQTIKPSVNVEHKQPTAIQKPDFPLQAFISPKVVNVPEIPKAYINKYQIEGLKIKREMETPVIEHAVNITQAPHALTEIKKPIVSNRADSVPSHTYIKDNLKVPNYNQHINSNHALQQKSINISSQSRKSLLCGMQTPRLDNSRQSTTLPDGKNLHDLLRELQDTINAGTGTKALDIKQVPSSNIKKEIKPMTRVPPLIPSTDIKPESTTTSQCAKQVGQQKKVENAPNTFSRLSYMHKNKQSDMKQARDSMANRNDQLRKQHSSELNRQITAFKNVKQKYLRTMGDTVITRVEISSHRTKPSETENVTPKSERQATTKDIPVIPNILNINQKTVPQRPVSRNDNEMLQPPSEYVTTVKPVQSVNQTASKSVKTTYLSEKDQNDLILLLRQQNRINAAGCVSASLITNPTEHSTQNINKTQNDISLNKNTCYPNMSKLSPDIFTKNLVCKSDPSLETNKTKTVLPNMIITNTKQNEIHSKSTENKPENVIRNSINFAKTAPKSADLKNKRVKKNILKNLSSEPMEDWEIVMNAIRAQKTPSRVPTAIDPVQINSSMSENNLRNHRIVRPNPTPSTEMTKTVSDISNRDSIMKIQKSESNAAFKINTKELTKLSLLNTRKTPTGGGVKIQTKIDASKRLSSEVSKKQLTCETLKEKDPFISGIENSDYDLLEELMDDDLRQEIGELSSDEDTYRNNTLLHSKGIKGNTSSKNNNMIYKSNNLLPQKDKPHWKCTKTMQTTSLLKCNYASKLSKETTVKDADNEIKIKSGVINSISNTEVEVTSKGDSNYQINKVRQSTEPCLPSKTIDKNSCVHKDNTQVTDSRNVFITAVPPPPPVTANVLVIGADVFYDPFISMQNQIHPGLSNISQTHQYLASNTSDITFHTTPFAAPVVSSLIIGNTITVPIEAPTAIPCGNVQTGTLPVSQPYITIPPMSVHATSFKNASTEVNEPDKVSIEYKNKPENDQELRDTGHATEYKASDNNSKISERKVLSEVQENQRHTEKCDVKIICNEKNPLDDTAKDSLKDLQKEEDESKYSKVMIPVQELHEIKVESDQTEVEVFERVKTKRLAILQRVISHRSHLPPIPLTYSPLPTKDHIFANNTNSTENCKENKSSLQCRRILLRSSNKDVPKMSANINDRNPIGRKTKVRLKDDIRELTDDVIEKNDEKIKKKRKKLSAPVKRATKVVKKRNEKIEKSTNESKNISLTKTSTKTVSVGDISINSSGDCELFDIESELLQSKIPNINVMTVTDSIINFTEGNTGASTKDKALGDKKENEESVNVSIDNDDNKSYHRNVTLPVNKLHKNLKHDKNELRSVATNETSVHSKSKEYLKTVDANSKTAENKNTVRKRKSNRVSTLNQVCVTTTNKCDENSTETNDLPMKSFDKDEERVDLDSGKHEEKNTLVKRKSNRISKLTSTSKAATSDNCTIATINQSSKSLEKKVIIPPIKNINIDIVPGFTETKKFKQSALCEVMMKTPSVTQNSNTGNATNNQSCSTDKITNQSAEPIEAVSSNQSSLYEKSNMGISMLKQIYGSVNVALCKNNKHICIPDRGKKIIEQLSKPVEAISNRRALDQESEVGMENLAIISGSRNTARHKNIKSTYISDKGTKIITQQSKSVELQNEQCTANEKNALFALNEKNKSVIPNVTPISVSESVIHHKNIKANYFPDKSLKTTEQQSKSVEPMNNKVVTSNNSFQNIFEQSPVLYNNTDCIQTNSNVAIIANNSSSTEVNSSRKDCTPNTRKRPIIDNIIQSDQSFVTSNVINEQNKSKSLTLKNDLAKMQSKVNQLAEVVDATKVVEPLAHSQINKKDLQNKIDCSGIPQSYKNKISFEELPCNQLDANMKRMRIKLSSGKVFTATVYGKMHTAFDSLFDDPAIRSILMSDVKEQKKYTLNIKQITTTNINSNKPQETRIQEIQVQSKNLNPKTIETINLLSDEEEDEVCNTFKTEFGQYKTSLKDKDLIAQHQVKFNHKCFVKIPRLPIPVLPIQEDQESNQSTSNLPVQLAAVCDRAVPEIVLPNVLNSQYMDTDKNKQITTEIIEIDDESSNDSIDLLKSCPNLPLELISDISKEVNYIDDSVNVPSKCVDETQTIDDNGIVRIDVQEKNSNSITNLNDEEIVRMPDTSPTAVDENKDAYNILTKSLNCFVQLTKCDDLIDKYKALEAMKRKCFVELTRCDDIIYDTQQSETEQNRTKDLFCNKSIQLPPHVSDVNLSSHLSRCPSLSIPNEFRSCNELRNENTRILLKSQNYDRNSPVMEVFEMIASLQKHSENAKEVIEIPTLSQKLTWKCSYNELSCGNTQSPATNYDNSPTVMEVFEMMALLDNCSRIINIVTKIPQVSQKLRCQCEWWSTKQQIREEYYIDNQLRSFSLPEKNISTFSNVACEQRNVKKIGVPSLMSLVTAYFQKNTQTFQAPSLMSLMSAYFQNNPVVGYSSSKSIETNELNKTRNMRNRKRKLCENRNDTAAKKNYKYSEKGFVIATDSKKIYECDELITLEYQKVATESIALVAQFTNNHDSYEVSKQLMEDCKENLLKEMVSTEISIGQMDDEFTEVNKFVNDEAPTHCLQLENCLGDNDAIKVKQTEDTSVKGSINCVGNKQICIKLGKDNNSDEKNAKSDIISNDQNDTISNDNKEVKGIEIMNILNSQCKVTNTEIYELAKNQNYFGSAHKDAVKVIKNTEVTTIQTILNSDVPDSLNIVLPNKDPNESIESNKTVINQKDCVSHDDPVINQAIKKIVEIEQDLEYDKGVDSMDIVTAYKQNKISYVDKFAIGVVTNEMTAKAIERKSEYDKTIINSKTDNHGVLFDDITEEIEAVNVIIDRNDISNAIDVSVNNESEDINHDNKNVTETETMNNTNIIKADLPKFANSELANKLVESQKLPKRDVRKEIQVINFNTDFVKRNIDNEICSTDDIEIRNKRLKSADITMNLSNDITSIIKKIEKKIVLNPNNDEVTTSEIEKEATINAVLDENSKSTKIDVDKVINYCFEKSPEKQNNCEVENKGMNIDVVEIQCDNAEDELDHVQKSDLNNEIETIAAVIHPTNNASIDIDSISLLEAPKEHEYTTEEKEDIVVVQNNKLKKVDAENLVNIDLEKSSEELKDRNINDPYKEIKFVDVGMDEIQAIKDGSDNNCKIREIRVENEQEKVNLTLDREKLDLTVYVNVVIDEVDKDEQDKLYNEHINNIANSKSNGSVSEFKYDGMKDNVVNKKTGNIDELDTEVHRVIENTQSKETAGQTKSYVSSDSNECSANVLISPQAVDHNAVAVGLLIGEKVKSIQGTCENHSYKGEKTNTQILSKPSTIKNYSNTFGNMTCDSTLIRQKEDEHVEKNVSDIVEKVKTKCVNSENSSIGENTVKNVELLYHGDTDVILKGIEYVDPVVGMCYVFPIAENVSVSSDNNVCVLNAGMQDSADEIIQIIEEIDDDITVTTNDKGDLPEDTLEVIIPKITYSKLYQDYKDLKRVKGKKNLKRKMDAIDPRLSAKKYRKGKNIDYPKITAVAMSDSAYGKEYKRVFDYCSSLTFSYSQPFHKELVDVEDIMKDWPIKGECSRIDPEVGEFSAIQKDSELFIDSEDKPKYNTLKLSLSEEISMEYNENIEVSADVDETNFNMGFGEGSGRVIQNLGDVDYISKVSAATLSDVKQPQPFLLSEDYDDCKNTVTNQNVNYDQIEKARRYLTYIQLRDKVRTFFKQTTIALKHEWLMHNKKLDSTNFPFDHYIRDFIEPCPVEAVVQVVQVGQLPVSAAAQNPVSCDPRVTQVSDASPSQCSVENSPHDDSPSAIKTEYTELTTADLTMPLVQDYTQHTPTLPMESHEPQKIQMTDENIPIETEIKSIVKIELMEELPEEKEDSSEPQDITRVQTLADKHLNNVEYSYETNNSNLTMDNSNLRMMYIPPEKQVATENFSQVSVSENFPQQTVSENFSPHKQQNGSAEKTDQIAHAMNAAGITTTSETIANTRAQALVNMLSQKIRQGGVPVNTQTTASSYSKATSINAMALQQALAQILPPPLNQTNVTENNQPTSNTQVTPQVLHIVQGKNASGSQITLLDNSQQSVISGPNTTPVLHIVQNKSGTAGATTNGAPVGQTNSFSGLSLVDAGLQQGGNQLLHIVNTGGQKNNNAGQLLKRVNLLTNLANVQGSNDQKMVQFVCKSADGKAIQLNAPHQRSMVLRLQPIESPNVQPATPKPVENQELNQSSNTSTTLANKDNATQQEIKSRSVYEENYAKFIQSSNKPAAVPVDAVKATSLPKFNQAFGKPVFQEGNQKPNEIAGNNIPSVNTGTTAESTECQASDNTMNLDHIGQISSPPLLLRKSPATSQSQPNLVQHIKQTIAPMNIQTMHGGVIYTRQIPVNIGGGQTINLITVPSTELIDDSGQKQQPGNQGEVEPSIIKIVPQNQTTAPNSEISTDDNANAHIGVTNENGPTPQPQSQPVLTQMRIKLPMLSKTPQMVSGARVVRPSFFQIQRNVIGGANQPVYQQLVLTAAPPLGQQTIRLPQAQGNRQIKVPTENQAGESQMSSSTLEQLREFDMVLEQVKERSTVQPNINTSTFSKLHTSSADTTDSTSSASTASVEPTQVLYSIGNNQSLNVTYVNRKATVTTPTTSTYVRSPDSSGIADSPTSSTHVQIPHTVTTEASASETPTQPKPAKVGSKSKSRPKSSSHLSSSMKLNSVPPKTSTQKPLEDEQTTQRILYILAEYKEQVENSPDKDKPAPRRRSNPPSNPSGSSKRKKSSSGSRRPGHRDMSPVHGDETCRTMGSEDSSCGTSQGDCNENCLESHSPQDSPRKIVRKLTFEQETPIVQPRPQPQRNVIVADGQTITVARGTTGKPTTAVLMPANYILPVSMVKGGQQIAIVTNRGPKLLTVGGGEGGATNALLLQRLIGPAGLKPVLARPGVRHVRLPTTALHNLQAFNLATATTIQPPDSTASPAPAPTPPELVETRATSSPWTDRESQDVKPERASSPEGSESWNLQSSADPHEYTYEETVRADNMDRTVLDPIPDRYSPDMEAQRIFDKMFDVDTKKSYIVDSHDDSPRCAYDIDASDCDDKAYHQVVHKKDGSSHRQHRLTHVSAAALRHKYAILEHELRLQKSLSEECEDLGVDSPSASELFPEAELLFAASPAHDHTTQDQVHHQSHTPQPTILNQSCIPQPDMDDQIATDQLLQRDMHDDRTDINLGLEDVGIVTVSEDGMQATIQLDHEEFAKSHPNTTFHSEPTEEGEIQPFTITGLKGRHITSTIFHSNRAPATVLMTAPQTTVISQATGEASGGIKYINTDIDNMINSLPSTHGNINLSSVLVKDDGLTRFDNILNDTRELHLTNTASAIVHSTGNATQVIRRVCYDDKRDRDTSFLMDEPDALIAGDDAKMVGEDSSRDATLESMTGDVDDDRSSPERHTELFWESNSASERSESRRPLDFSSDSDKCCKSPSYDETNSTDSSGVGTHMRLDSVIKEARGIDRSGSADGSSADDTHPPLRTYPPKRMYHPLDGDMERSLTGKTRAGERSPDLEIRRRASGRGVVKRGCHCCNGSPAPPRPKKSRQRKPTLDFSTH